MCWDAQPDSPWFQSGFHSYTTLDEAMLKIFYLGLNNYDDLDFHIAKRRGLNRIRKYLISEISISFTRNLSKLNVKILA